MEEENLIEFSLENRNDSIYNNLENFRLSEKFTDITLICDGNRYHAHRLILALNSGYFAQMLELSKHEAASPVVWLCGVKAPILKMILKFIYTGKVTVSSDDVVDLFNAGSMLEIPGLLDTSKENKLDLSSQILLNVEKNDESNIDPKSSSQLENQQDSPAETPVNENKSMKNEIFNRVPINGLADSATKVSSGTRVTNTSPDFLNDISDDGDAWEGWDDNEIEKGRRFNKMLGKKSRKRNQCCYICNRKFLKIESLNRHLKVHTSVSYSCSYCQKEFNNPKKFNFHMIIHENNKTSNFEQNVPSQVKIKQEQPDEEPFKRICLRSQSPDDGKTIDDVLGSVTESFRRSLDENFSAINDAIYDNEPIDSDQDVETQVVIKTESFSDDLSNNEIASDRICISSFTDKEDLPN